MKKNRSDEGFDHDFSWYTVDDLLNLAFDKTGLAQLDGGDMMNLIRELGIRLQQSYTELQKLQ